MSPLKTRRVESVDEIRAFFDDLATTYQDSHGDGEKLLNRRLALIRRLLNGTGRSLLVEIGCGNGLHMFPLAGGFQRILGTDLSPKMIAAAEQRRRDHPLGDRIRLAAAEGRNLAGVAGGTADAVLCVGAFEHMQDKPAVLAEVRRVLKTGGVFICLSPNGGYLWYTLLAPWLGLETRHLSTDRFLDVGQWRALLREAGFESVDLGYWGFVPAGDMPAWAANLMQGLDWVGRRLGIAALRGGCYVKAVKGGAEPIGRSDE